MGSEGKALEKEINLVDYWQVIWARKLLIIMVAAVLTAVTAIYSLTIEDIYQARAVIMPVNRRADANSGLSTLAQQFGGLSLPASASSSEILSLLKSNQLRERAINEYGLMRELFPVKPDGERAAGYTGLIKAAMAAVRPGAKAGMGSAPTVWDGIRKLDSMLTINFDIKENTITVTSRHTDPRVAAKVVESMLAALMDHMSGEAKRIARINKKYLENQLYSTADPIIRQKIYNLIAQQIETSMMSEMKENFAFTMIDSPREPDRKVFPDRKKIVKIGSLISLFTGISFGFLVEYRGRRKSL